MPLQLVMRRGCLGRLGFLLKLSMQKLLRQLCSDAWQEGREDLVEQLPGGLEPLEASLVVG